MADTVAVRYIASLDSSGVTRGAKRAKGQTAALDKQTRRLQATMLATSPVVQELGRQLLGLVQAGADTVNNLEDMATRTGVASSTLSGLKLAAQSSGERLESLNSVLGPLNARLGQVRLGSKEAEEAFSTFGVQIRDAQGNLLTTEEVLGNTVRRLNQIEDSGQRAQLATTLLGRSGSKLIQIMGGKELESWVDQADRFGTVVGPRAKQAAADWQAGVAQLSAVMDGLRIAIVENLGGPVMTVLQSIVVGFGFVGDTVSAVVSGLRDSMTSFMDDMVLIYDALNKPLTMENLRGLADTLGEVRANGERASEEFSAGVAQAMEDSVQKWGGLFESSGAAIGGSMADGILAGVGEGLDKELQKVIEDTIDFKDTGWGKDRAIDQFIQYGSGTGEGITDSFKGSGKSGGSSIKGSVLTGSDAAAIEQGFTAALQSGDLAGLLQNAAGSIFGTAAMGPVGVVLQVVGSIEGILDSLDSQVKGLFADLQDFPNQLARIPDLLQEWLDMDWGAMLGELVIQLKIVLLELAWFFLVQWPIELVKAIPRIAIGFITAIWDRIKELFSDMFRGIRDFVETPFRGREGKVLGTSFKKGDMSILGMDLPRFGSGAYVNGPTPAIVGDRPGGEVVMGTDQLRRAMGRGGGGRVHVTVEGGYFDDAALRRLVDGLRRVLGPNGLGESLEGY